MKKAMLSVLLALVLCLTVFVLPASAADNGIGVLQVADTAQTGEGMDHFINWFKSSKDGKYYLLLPSSYDKSSLTVSFSASDAVYCGETELVSGEITDVFAGGSAVLTCGGNSYQVVVLDGGATGSVFINTESGSLDAVHADKEYKEPGTVRVIDENGESMYDGALDYIKGRGNSTWGAAKKPYNIKLGKKADLFGMGKAKKWCLLANSSDATLLHNQMSYSLAKSLGVETTSDVIPVGLYVNGNYMGAYSITEKVEIGENRVDITDLEKLTEAVNEKELDRYALGGDQRTTQKGTYQYVKIPNNPEDISGGYLLELEKVYRYVNEDSGFISNRGQAIVMKSPEAASKAQVEYMRAYYQEFEDALYSYTGYNSLGKHFSDYIDLDSIAAMYITEEFGENFDGCSSSFFLYKDVDGKLTAGPAWDFDLAFSTNSRLNTLINRTAPLGDPQSLYIQHCFIDNYDESHKAFLAQLFTHDEFQQTVQRIWNNSFKQLYPDYETGITDASNIVSSQAIMNAIRWNSYGTTNTESILSSYQSRVATMRSFAASRYEYLSQAYDEGTFFVKYDIGDEGTTLVFDTNMYMQGEQATVVCDPVSETDQEHFLYWTANPDGTGTQYRAGDTLTVSGNVNLYAKWEDHILAADPDGTETCTVCAKTYHNGELIPDGWFENSYFKNHLRLSGIQNVEAPDGSGSYYYDFGDDGQLKDKFTGIFNGYYYSEGLLAKNAGIIKLDGSYYYIGQRGQVYANGTLTITQDKTNDLLPAGKYTFAEDGRIILKQGIIDGFYYVDGTIKKGAGVIKLDGSYYYIGQRGQVYANGSLYLKAEMTNGYFPAGRYTFAADGKIVLKQGIVDGFYYIDGVLQKNAGVIKLDGSYYYIGQRGQVYANGSLYLNADMTNGYFPAGKYTFAADGKIIR